MTKHTQERLTHPFRNYSLTAHFIFSQSIQIWLKSVRGPIDVYLCPEDQGNQPSPMKDLSPVKRTPPAQIPPDYFLLTPEKTPHNCGGSMITAAQNFNREQQRAIPTSVISPQKNLLLQTNDGAIPEDLDSDSLIPLSPNLTDEEYLFTLTDTEGITDLFDSYSFWNEA